MPLHPQAQAMIASVAGGTPVEQMSVQQGREALEQRVHLTGGQPEPVDKVISSEVPGPAGAIQVRIYVPAVSPAERKLPGLVFFHGGGWVRGSLNSHDILCRSLANGGGCIVVSVDYRMAPEHPYPAAVDDAGVPFSMIVPPLIISICVFPLSAWLVSRIDAWRLGR